MSNAYLSNKGLETLWSSLTETRLRCFEIATFLTYMRKKADIKRGGERLTTKDRYVQALLDSITSLTDGMQQTVLSIVSVLESRRAIEEANNIGKLTQLAFFFIPLTFVAGLFGMDVIVSTPSFLVDRELDGC